MSAGKVSGGFVGRAQALAVLEEAWARARAGRSSTVLVAGEAGIGKTRLVREFLGRAGDGRVLLGACLELGEDAAAFAPITAALRGLLREVGVAGVAELLPAAPAELARLLPELGTAAAAEDGSRARLFETILVLLEQLATARPLVVVVEDAHWADRSTLDLLRFLVHNLGAAPVMFLVTHRDLPLHHPLRPVVAQLVLRHGVEQLTLPRLTRHEVAAQARTILGREPEPGLLDSVYRRSTGNPLFVEALLSAGGDLRAALAGPLGDLLVIPVERLPAESRWLLCMAAVGGSQVGHALLAAVSGLDEPTLEEALRPAFGPVLVAAEEGYAFRHALIREAVHDGLLLPGERRRLHRRYAEALERDASLVPADQMAVELAHHWHAAGDPPKAFDAAWQAARQAHAAFAHAERLRMLQRLLRLWSRVPDPAQRIGLGRGEVLRHAVEAADESGELDLGMALAAEALDTIDAGRAPVLAAEVYERRARMRRKLGREGALADLRAALQVVPADPPSTMRARLLGYLAHRLMVEADRSQALAAAEQAEALADLVGDAYAKAHAITTRASLSAGTEETKAVRATYARAREIAASASAPMLTVRAYIEESDMLEGRGEHELAAESARAGLSRAREVGLARTLGVRLATNLAEPLIALGRWDEALEVIEHGIELNPPSGYLAPLYRFRGEVMLARGFLPEATEAQEAIAALHAQFDAPMDYFPQAHFEAGVLLVQGWPADAVTVIERALDTFDSSRGPRYAWPLLVIGARASLALTLHTRLIAEASLPGTVLERRLRGFLDTLTADTPVQRAHRATLAAELAEPAARAAASEEALAAWERTAQPYPLAQALLRSAEHAAAGGDRLTAAQRLRRCVALAGQLLAAPLVREAHLLAQRARIAMPEHETAPPSELPADTLGLTPREREVLSLVALGRTNRQIAEELFISVKTASVHVSRILTKLGAANRVEAAATAHRLHLVDQAADMHPARCQEHHSEHLG
jgi:DNA-binding NarL/FixJ family response regulator/tetratricopeptide (TPR) repeat protein